MATAQLGTLLRHIHQLAAPHSARQRTDRQLLEDFACRRDEAAFAALVARHGPMVLRVCRRVLKHEQDAEDAFQATFLVLARNIGSIRKHDALANWLYGVAYRTAMKAKRSAARRRKHEARLQAGRTDCQSVPPTWDDVQASLDEEIQLLPDRYRAAFVLCVLEGKSGPQAAAELSVKEGTVWSRLTRARKLLQQRLIRRGIKLASVVAALSVAESAGKAAVPAVLASATVRHGLLVAAGGTAARVIPSHIAALAAGVTRAMFLTKAKIAVAVLLTIGLFTAGVLTHQALAVDETSPFAQKIETPTKEQAKPQTARAAADSQAEKSAGFEVTGRVLDPEGKPLAGAKLFLYGRGGLKDDRAPTLRATTGPGGLFRLQVSRSELVDSVKPDPWKDVQLVASAPGFGSNWVPLGRGSSDREITVKLVADDVPIEGRVLTLENRPLKGVTVSVFWLWATAQEDLTPWIKAVKAGNPDAEVTLLQPKSLPAKVAGLPASVSTDSSGRFRLTGIGRERMVLLWIKGPTIASKAVRVLTRHEQPIRYENKAFESIRPDTYYGATFEHLASPTRPVVGTVRAGDTGKPLAGVTIESIYGNATTGREGGYRLVGMPPNVQGPEAGLTAVPPESEPYFQAAKTVSGGPGLEQAVVDFELKRGIWVTGRVTDQKTGKPLPGVWVQYEAGGDNPNVGAYQFVPRLPGPRTGADGSFRILALPGHGQVAATTYDWRYLAVSDRGGAADHGYSRYGTDPRRYNAIVQINPDKDAKSVRCDLTLEPGRTVQGTALDPDGKPLAGAKVSGLGPVPEWESLEGSSFTVAALKPGRPRRLLFAHEGRRLAGSLVVRGDEDGPVRIRLEPWGTLTGRLVDDQGQAYADIHLRIGLMSNWEHDAIGGIIYRVLPSIFQTDRRGQFRIEGLVPGLKYYLGAQGPKEMPFWSLRDLSTRPGETEDLGDVKEKKVGESAAGFVVPPSGGFGQKLPEGGTTNQNVTNKRRTGKARCSD